MFPKIYLSVTLLAVASIVKSQDFSIEEKYDHLTENWLEISTELKNYAGLSGFCISEEFRNYTTKLLKEMHHYDSVVLKFLNEPGSEELIGHHEYKNTLMEIGRFEEEYDIKSFMSFLGKSCVARNDLERNKDDLKNEVGMYSYDGQIVVLETEVHRFLNHIDKRVVSIDKHLHKIHPDRFQFKDALASGYD